MSYSQEQILSLVQELSLPESFVEQIKRYCANANDADLESMYEVLQGHVIEKHNILKQEELEREALCKKYEKELDTLRQESMIEIQHMREEIKKQEIKEREGNDEIAEELLQSV